uniref:Uncharacterized protein n=1 Tax=Rhizophora mucronata TaxID=61149 RepID=A0A2P2JW79_RHIMU
MSCISLTSFIGTIS